MRRRGKGAQIGRYRSAITIPRLPAAERCSDALLHNSRSPVYASSPARPGDETPELRLSHQLTESKCPRSRRLSAPATPKDLFYLIVLVARAPVIHRPQSPDDCWSRTTPIRRTTACLDSFIRLRKLARSIAKWTGNCERTT